MTQYRGYYIDKVIFNNKTDIDNFIKDQAVERFKKLNKYFAEDPCMEVSAMCTDQARYLHENYGFSYEELEEMEIEALKEIA